MFFEMLVVLGALSIITGTLSIFYGKDYIPGITMVLSGVFINFFVYMIGGIS